MKKSLLAMLVLFPIMLGCNGTFGTKWSAEDGTPITVPQIVTNADHTITTNRVPLVIHEVK